MTHWWLTTQQIQIDRRLAAESFSGPWRHFAKEADGGRHNLLHRCARSRSTSSCHATATNLNCPSLDLTGPLRKQPNDKEQCRHTATNLLMAFHLTNAWNLLDHTNAWNEIEIENIENMWFSSSSTASPQQGLPSPSLRTEHEFVNAHWWLPEEFRQVDAIERSRQLSNPNLSHHTISLVSRVSGHGQYSILKTQWLGWATVLPTTLWFPTWHFDNGNGKLFQLGHWATGILHCNTIERFHDSMVVFMAVVLGQSVEWWKLSDFCSEIFNAKWLCSTEND